MKLFEGVQQKRVLFENPMVSENVEQRFNSFACGFKVLKSLAVNGRVHLQKLILAQIVIRAGEDKSDLFQNAGEFDVVFEIFDAAAAFFCIFGAHSVEQARQRNDELVEASYRHCDLVSQRFRTKLLTEFRSTNPKN